MSDNKVRYFQGSKSGCVVRAVGAEAAQDLGQNPGMTEVQVVPLDAIVIRRDELPERENLGRWSRFDGVDASHTAPASTPEVHEARARAHLAAAEYLREFPPVDKAQVKAVRDALLSSDDYDVNYIEGDDAWKLARRMVERGVRVEQP